MILRPVSAAKDIDKKAGRIASRKKDAQFHCAKL
jgi:hypothetical protein